MNYIDKTKLDYIVSKWNHLWQLYRISNDVEVKYMVVKRIRINSSIVSERYSLSKLQAVRLIKELKLMPQPQPILAQSTVYRKIEHQEILSQYRQKRVFRNVVFTDETAKGTYKGLTVLIQKENDLFYCKIKKKQKVLLDKPIYSTNIYDATDKALVATGY